MEKYRLVNNTAGWITFAVSAIVYLMTIEPTASFWDCPEFISSAYKLEVGHAPGAPMFMLTANLFSRFAPDPSHVAMMVNAMSALFSALTILFLFWSITHLAKKIVVKNDGDEMTTAQLVKIMGAGLVGALVYTFSDTFWFSAVEGEVYAYSSLFTAIVFWMILKWESVADKPHADRWIVLIAYMMGLSIGVHLLNLLCIPAIVLVYYFKKYPHANLKGSLIALCVSFAIIGLLLYGLVQGVVKVCGWFELLFVNQFGLPYHSGVFFYLILVFGSLAWGLWETMQAKRREFRLKISFLLSVVLLGLPFFGSIWLGACLVVALFIVMYVKKNMPVKLLNTTLTCLLVILIGYSSYALIVIRSSANTPMDQNSPENIFALASYLNREQYGDRPLIYGETFVSDLKRESNGSTCTPAYGEGKPIWARIVKTDPSEKDRYFVAERKDRVTYVDELNMFFPRMYSSEERHVAAYKEWSNFKGAPVTYETCGQQKTVYKPTFAENLRFFVSYQLNFMYWRYFMWNFSGRQNDIQGNGEVSNGNWITGIKFIDERLAGPQDNLPYSIGDNKGHNVYYMLPLLLGILGLFFQAYSGRNGVQGFWITFFLFFMTGIAIVIYLNQTPLQPRERDYAYAGSFYAFCIWVGLGVLAVAEGIRNYLKAPVLVSALAATVLCLFIPVQMASQNWDDHDRSKRSVCRAFGFNYLSSCAPHAIIFTVGDNDTFPLWYAQEVEGYRRDVRVCNLGYLNTDWYIDQMKRQAYESPPLPISWSRSEYVGDTHNVAFIFPLTDQPLEVSTAFRYMRSADPAYKRIPGYSEGIDIIPSQKLYIKADSASVVGGGILPPDSAHLIPSRLELDYSEKQVFIKGEMMVLEVLSAANWQRPAYFDVGVLGESQVGLGEKYLRQEGMANRIVPFDVHETGQEIQKEISYHLLMNTFVWGGIENPKVYLDENVRNMIGAYYRTLFARTADAFTKDGQPEKAIELLDRSCKVIPAVSLRYDYYALQIALAYLNAGVQYKGIAIMEQVMDYYMRNLDWYFRLNESDFRSVYTDVRRDMQIVQMILSHYQEINPKLIRRYWGKFVEYSERLQA